MRFSVGSKMAVTLKEIRENGSDSLLLMEAVSNDDKGKLFEILHAKHIHPEIKLPTHYRDEEGKSPEEVHNSIKGRISKQEYVTIEGHARDSAANMREHLRGQGHNPNHITHVAWTSNGATDVKKFTDKDDPHNDSDVMYRFKHPKTGKVTHAGVGLKYGSQKEPNLRNPGLDSLERMTGAKTLVSRFEKHKKNIKALGYTGTAGENHAKWKTEKTSKRGKAADQSKLETTRGIAKDMHAAFAGKSSSELMTYVRGIVSPRTVHPTYRMHTRTAHNEPGASASHHIDEPSKDIEQHLSQFSELMVDKKHPGGISVVIRGKRKGDGKVVPVLTHAVKGVSGPMKGLAATTKLSGYRSGKKKTLNEMLIERDIHEKTMAAAQRAQAVFNTLQNSRIVTQKRITSDSEAEQKNQTREAITRQRNAKAAQREARAADVDTATYWRDEEGNVRGVGGSKFASTMAKQANLERPNNFKLEEEAPANAMGTAGISGAETTVDAGIAGYDLPIGMVRRQSSKMFGGKRVFTVPSKDYYKATLGRKKGQHWRSMVNGPLGEEIRQYALENKEAPIIVEDETTGAMMYLKYGKR